MRQALESIQYSFTVHILSTSSVTESSPASNDAATVPETTSLKITISSSPPPASNVPSEGGVPQGSVVTVTVTPVAHPETPAERNDAAPQVLTVLAIPGRSLAVQAQVVALSVPASPPPPGVGGFFAPTPGTPAPVTELTLIVSSSTQGPGPAQPDGNLASPSSAGQPAPITALAPVNSADELLAADGGTAKPVEYQFQVTAVQGSTTALWPGPLSLSSPTDPSDLGNGQGSRSAGDRDTGLAQTAARRKALALGLRYLYPDLTDDEIAQAAGVSRRTLFRWDEYMTLKKAQRELYKRPRGYKDRDGNLEAWEEEDE